MKLEDVFNIVVVDGLENPMIISGEKMKSLGIDTKKFLDHYKRAQEETKKSSIKFP